jgi:WS/DGAT/MGAT family acyltransferase
MQQLSAQDATFLHLESPRTPMHIGSLAIYDQSSAPDGHVTFKSILAMTQERLGLARSFTERLVHVPLGLDHPYWVSDPDFDLEYHIRHIALPKPGDWRQLWIQVARLQSRPLDMDRPLWEFTVIEGLDNLDGVPAGAFGILAKVHHSAIDGVSGAEMTAAVHDLEPEAPPPDAPAPPSDVVPRDLELLARAGVNSVRQPFRMAPAIRETVPALRRWVETFQKDDVTLPAVPGRVPGTRFNTEVSPHRVVIGTRFDLDEVKSIKNMVEGATINDAILTICAGGLRRYLDYHGDLPEESMTAMAPISVRSDEEQAVAGNRVSAMVVRLRTDIVDDVERLGAIREATRGSKELTNAVGARLMTDYGSFIPAATAGLASRLATRIATNSSRPLVNCTITNVPGPQIPLYSAGAKLLDLYGTGPIVDGMGLIIPVFSYCGGITVSATSCREIMPDPERFIACVEESFEDLRAVARP